MNIRGMANGATSQVNPNQSIAWKQSTGYTSDAAGKRTPSYTSTPVDAQVQGLSASDLKHIDGLNIQGVMRSVVMYGNVQGVNRVNQQGGDILQFPEVPNGTVRDWLVVQVMETWPEWCRVVVVLQVS